jgi:ketosteroid isomerase-like protein
MSALGPNATLSPVTPLNFSIEHWAAFWANPHPELAGRLVTPDVVVHWPGDPEPVRGVTRYKQRLADVLAAVPDLRLEVAEHATHGDLLFVRWVARGTATTGPFELDGVDRVHLRDGLVREIRIYYDPTAIGRPGSTAARTPSTG